MWCCQDDPPYRLGRVTDIEANLHFNDHVIFHNKNKNTTCQLKLILTPTINNDITIIIWVHTSTHKEYKYPYTQLCVPKLQTIICGYHPVDIFLQYSSSRFVITSD